MKPVATVANNISLQKQQIFWNGSPVSEQSLDDLLRQVRDFNPPPFIIFDPGVDPDCEAATRIRDKIDKSLHCRNGNACWQGSRAVFGRMPEAPLTGTGVP